MFKSKMLIVSCDKDKTEKQKMSIFLFLSQSSLAVLFCPNVEHLLV